jgi:hypothetical protein
MIDNGIYVRYLCDCQGVFLKPSSPIPLQLRRICSNEMPLGLKFIIGFLLDNLLGLTGSFSDRASYKTKIRTMQDPLLGRTYVPDN